MYLLTVAAAAPLAGILTDRVGVQIVLVVGVASLAGAWTCLGVASASWYVYAALVELAAPAHALIQLGVRVAIGRASGRRRGPTPPTLLGLGGADAPGVRPRRVGLPALWRSPASHHHRARPRCCARDRCPPWAGAGPRPSRTGPAPARPRRGHRVTPARGPGGPLTVRSEFSSIDGDCRQGSRLRRSRLWATYARGGGWRRDGAARGPLWHAPRARVRSISRAQRAKSRQAAPAQANRAEARRRRRFGSPNMARPSRTVTRAERRR